MPLDRPDGIRSLVRNIAEVAIGDSSVWVPVAGNVEGVERVKPEAHRLLANDMKVLEHGHVYVEISGPAGVAIARRSKGIRRGCAEGAWAVVNSCRCARSRRRIRAVPVINATVHDFQLPILVRPRVTVTIGVISRSQDGFRKASVSHARSRDPPPANRFVKNAVGVRKVSLAASYRQGIDAGCTYVMPYVVTGRAPVCGAVVVVLEGALATEESSGHVHRIIARAVGQRFRIRVVERELQSMAHPLPHDGLQRAEIHRRARFRDQQGVGPDAYGRINRVHAY